MKKFTVLFVVVVVQVGIVYGFYRWYKSSEGSETAPQTLTSAPANTPATTPASGVNPVTDVKSGSAISQVPGVPPPAPSPNAATPAVGQPKPSSTEFRIKHPSTGKPLSYQKAITGDIAGIPETKNAKAGILVDLDSREVLWSKKSKAPAPIASMTKMMTALLTFEDIENFKITLDTEIQGTSESSKMGGSQIYIDPKESFSLRDLLKAVMIKSANDASYLVAQHLAGGDVSSFIARMNSRAKELGMLSTHFYNTNGLPGATAKEDNVASAEDMVLLAERLLEYPEAVKDSSTASATIERKVGKNPQTLLSNHNHLVSEKCPGVNGMKTGFIARSGFCITITCERNGRRMAAVIMGYPSDNLGRGSYAGKGRDLLGRKLLDFGYSGKAPPTPPHAKKSEHAQNGAAAAKPATKKAPAKSSTPAAAAKPAPAAKE